MDIWETEAFQYLKGTKIRVTMVEDTEIIALNNSVKTRDGFELSIQRTPQQIEGRNIKQR